MVVKRKVCKCGKKYIVRRRSTIKICNRCFRNDNKVYDITCCNCNVKIKFKKSLGQILGINNKGVVICKKCNELHIVIYNNEEDTIQIIKSNKEGEI